jgi:uncharacterized protein with NRDE domain
MKIMCLLFHSGNNDNFCQLMRMFQHMLKNQEAQFSGRDLSCTSTAAQTLMCVSHNEWLGLQHQHSANHNALLRCRINVARVNHNERRRQVVAVVVVVVVVGG